MAKLTGIEQIRDAIGAFNSGETNIADLERLIGTALATGSVSRLDASMVIRADCKPGAAASGIIDNLGLDDIIAPMQRAAPAGVAAQRLGTQPSARAASETRVRITGMPAPAPGEPNRASTDKLHVGVAAGTDAVWADPDSTSAAPAARGMIGQLLGGRYLLERELGRGGMGEVYLASDQEVVGELFAIKVLKPEIRAYPEALPLLREEVRTTRALRHPNIVGVYSLNSDRSHIYMLMEYLEGKTLDALLDQEFGRGMPFSRAWPLILDMCDALAYAHDHSVIHSDLKPSNVFVTLAGRAKLLDFGIARVARTRNGRFDPSTVGALTLAYASCEMLEGGKPDQSDDVFSLACVIYEMLSGRHPFDLRSALEAREEGYRVTPIPLLAPSQNAALGQALAFARGKRTATVEALLAGLEPTTVQQAPPERAKDAAVNRARRSTAQGKGTARQGTPSEGSRNPSVIAVIGLVAAILIGGFSLLLYRAREHAKAATSTAARMPASPPTSTAQQASAPPPVASAQPSAPPPVAPAQPNAPPPTVTRQPSAPPPSPQPAVPDAAPVPPTVAAHTPAISTIGAATQPSAPPPTAGTHAAVASTTGAGAAAGSAALSPPATTAENSAPARHDAAMPPVGKHVPSVKPLPDSEASIDSCPYPDQLLRQGHTGSVGVLVLISPDGGTVATKIDESSGSDELDAAAARCVQDYGQFSPKRGGPRAGYWGHMRFNFSFGG
jgi:TonB family protein